MVDERAAEKQLLNSTWRNHIRGPDPCQCNELAHSQSSCSLRGDGENRSLRAAGNHRDPSAPIELQKATTGFEPVMEVLQTSALPLGHVATRLREIACRSAGRSRNGLERAMGFEPTTFSLARRRSTTELHPRPDEDTVKEWASQALSKLADSSGNIGRIQPEAQQDSTEIPAIDCARFRAE